MMAAVTSPRQNVNSYFSEKEEEMLQQFYVAQILTIILYCVASSLGTLLYLKFSYSSNNYQ